MEETGRSIDWCRGALIIIFPPKPFHQGTSIQERNAALPSIHLYRNHPQQYNHRDARHTHPTPLYPRRSGPT